MSRVLLVDATQLLHRTASVQAKQIGSETPVYGPKTVVGALGMIRSLAQRFFPLHLYLIWDGQRSARRSNLFPEYKAGRGAPSSSDFQAKWMDIGEISGLSKKMGCRVLVLPQKEADDVICHLCLILENPTVVSNDRDFLQLVKEGASIYLPDQDKYVGPLNFRDSYPIYPDQYLLYKAVLGDKSDGIPGVRGVGDKTILPLLQNNSKIVSADDLIGDLSTRPKLSARERTLFQSRDVLLRNLELIDLKREIFSDQELSSINQCLQTRVSFDESVHGDFERLGATQISEFFVTWTSPFRRLI